MNTHTNKSESFQQFEIRMGDGLIILNVLSVMTVVAVIFLPLGILTALLSIPYLLFFPGYALVSAIFVRQDEISGVERIALSVGLSFVIVVLIGLILNYTMWGIRVVPVVCTVFGFVFITSVIAWSKRNRLVPGERFSVAINLSWLNPGKSAGSAALTAILLIAILGAFSYLAYLVSNPKTGEPFSEFYVLGHPGTSAGYPGELVVGEEVSVFVGIVNHENREVIYSIRVSSGDSETNLVGPVHLADGASWEGEVVFSAASPGEDKKFEFMLYRDGEDRSCKTLHLWIDVTEGT